MQFDGLIDEAMSELVDQINRDDLPEWKHGHFTPRNFDAMLNALSVGSFEEYPDEPPKFDKLEVAEHIIAKTGAVIEPEVEAPYGYYQWTTDRIGLPTIFKNRDMYYATVFHELGHWTGHDSRLGRGTLGQPPRSPAQTIEEMIAELTAVMILKIIGITSQVERNARYVKNFYNRAGFNQEQFDLAAAAAREATYFILEKAA